MPRAKKTATGKPAQPIQAFTGQQYGQGVAQESLQRAMPTPNEVAGSPKPTPTAPQTTPQASAPQTSSPQEQQTPKPDFATLLQQIQGQGGVLNRPDEQPNVPYNATLSSGDPSARIPFMPKQSRTGDIMRELSRRTGDPTFADLAARAGY